MKGLYIVTPDWDDTAALLRVTEQALQGGAALVQYRHKTATPTLRREQAAALLALCRRAQRPFIINDHLDLCLELDADGLHVGGTDAPVAQIRQALGEGKIVGASCYGDLELAKRAHREGASYVAFGGFYPSRVKKYPVTTAVDIIAQSHAEVPLPIVVIGGMTVQNSAPLVAAGADMVAAISSVYGAQQPKEAARDFAGLWA
ncbi:thiamine phosphate synthase [Lacisediminimonas sp.]|uniref:thiamine phosphate synthase n=1 Tax=Lacisediminimonas sp. TaxID=3060582 RepID=UPI00271C2733|nr:thiamine phosphate synthase [Lacisediminimonas sp.]MDO8299705.1 thiamine phosphate synthase [Lacisediminimonas sp.]